MTRLRRASRTFVLALAVLGMTSHLSAQTSGKLGWALKLGAEFGGDTVATVRFSDGSTQTITAGRGISLGVGGHYRPVASQWDFSGTIGLKYATTKASNASISINRTELEFRADYLLREGWWIGAGPVWHTGTKFDADGLARNISFDPAMGITAKVGWNWIAISFTGMNYKDEFGNSYSASNFGFSLIGKF